MSVEVLDEEIKLAYNPEQIAFESALSLTEKFLNLEVESIVLRTSYWMNHDPGLQGSEYYQTFPQGGKRSPEEIINLIETAIHDKGVDISGLNEDELRRFMWEKGIGVDCSGFAYQVCREVFVSLGGHDFDSVVIGRELEERGITKTAARDLTDSKNSFPIPNVNHVMPGDLIRCKGGRHVIVFLGINDSQMECVHSSDAVATPGVSRFLIAVTNPMGTIFEQEWGETRKGGRPYVDVLKEKYEDGDGIWRLNIINNLYSNLEGSSFS